MIGRMQLLIRRAIYMIGSAGILVAGTLSFQLPAFAAGTATWIGTTCASGSQNCNWSDTGNWAGGTVPSAGSDVVFDNTVMNGHGSPIDDITGGLAINSITFTNDVGPGALSVYLAAPLTVNSAITQASSVTQTSDALVNNTTSQILTLGGNVTVSRSKDLTLGSPSVGQPDTIALAGHTLTFNDTASSASGVVSINAVISGSGTVTYNAALTNFQLSTAATYSGTTNVIASNLWVGNVANNNINVFGTSTINIATGGSVEFANNTNTTITNPIVIAGTTGTSNVTSLNFSCALSCGSATTITIPNITLSGNTRFGISDANTTVNLAGITTNGHCIEYLNATSTNQFTNGPGTCIISGNGPGLPNTGALKNELPLALIAGSLSLLAAIEVSRRVRRRRI